MVRLLVWGILAIGALLAGGALLDRDSRSLTAQTPEGRQVTLFPGWNHVRYTGIALPVRDALHDAVPSVTAVWQFRAETQQWSGWSATLPDGLQSLTVLEADGIYFVRAGALAAWTHPLAAPPPGAAPAPASSPWQVDFRREATVFGLVERLVFEESGAGAVTGADGVARATAVSSTTVSTINGQLEANGFFRTWPSETSAGCVGCFRYTLVIRDRSGANITLQTDGAGLSGALFSLVEQLTAALLAVL